MREQRLLQYLKCKNIGQEVTGLRLGIGDDCAVLEVGADKTVVTSTDMLIEGVHYNPGVRPDLIGRKAVTRALSDLAAMACRPLACLVAVSFPPASEEKFARKLCDAFAETARQFDAPLIGGDISSGTDQLTITVTVFGVPGPDGIVSRSGAKPGDAICVTGKLGGAVQSGRHLTFRPRIREALFLNQRFEIHAMIDISDGLSTDIHHLCNASGVGATINADAVPVHSDLECVNGAIDRESLVHRALSGGEDYELLFCVPGEQISSSPITVALGETVERTGETGSEKGECNEATDKGNHKHDGRDHGVVPESIMVARVGTCTNESGIVLQWDDPAVGKETLEANGWEHQS